MSRKLTQLRKTLRQNARGRGETHASKWPAVTPANGANVTPTRATGSGKYLADVDNSWSKAPHGYRGDGQVCCLPAGEKFQRRLALALRK